MGLFPKIQSPCLYRGPLTDIMDGDICRLCSKAVIDLTEMGDDGRRYFIETCEGEVCVSYKVLLRPMLAATIAGAVAFAATAASAASAEQVEFIVTMAGGMRKPQAAEWVEHTVASNLPDLPVVYEDAPSDSLTDRTDANPPHADPAPSGT